VARRGRFDGVTAMRTTTRFGCLVVATAVIGLYLAAARPAAAQTATPTLTPTATATPTPTLTPTRTPTSSSQPLDTGVSHVETLELDDLTSHASDARTGRCKLYFAGGKLYFKCGSTIYEVTAPTPS